MNFHRHPLCRQTPRLLRVAAWAGVALMVMLVVGAANPQFHAWFHAAEHAVQADPAHPHTHGHAHHRTAIPFNFPALPVGTADDAPAVPDDDDGCVITVFAHGIVSLSAALVLLAGVDVLKPAHRIARDWITPAAPRYAWLRTHAPPAA
ncbi:hypothetical protein OPIT5_25625 [Opitutaceae bacterium TAV5]|nr:hypothetical protein OPIT5_25625 [Opitutaceae bacterium TAV5]